VDKAFFSLIERWACLDEVLNKRGGSHLAKKNQPVSISADEIESQIYLVRGQRVMLDADLAKLYGVPTKVFNQAVKRKAKRFPDDFSFHLTAQEVINLRSQIVTSSLGHGGRRYLPRAFTEHGVAMLSSILDSQTAIDVNIEIIRTFGRLRRLLATPGELVSQLQQLAETVQLHDEQIKVITDVLRKLMEPPPTSTKGRIGFQVPESPNGEESQE
jgi:hypothetical protein